MKSYVNIMLIAFVFKAFLPTKNYKCLKSIYFAKVVAEYILFKDIIWISSKLCWKYIRLLNKVIVTV